MGYSWLKFDPQFVVVRVYNNTLEIAKNGIRSFGKDQYTKKSRLGKQLMFNDDQIEYHT